MVQARGPGPGELI